MNALTPKRLVLAEIQAGIQAGIQAKNEQILSGLPHFMRQVNERYQENNLDLLKSIAQCCSPQMGTVYTEEKGNALKNHVFISCDEWFGVENVQWESGTVITCNIPHEDQLRYGLPATVTVSYGTFTD